MIYAVDICYLYTLQWRHNGRDWLAFNMKLHTKWFSIRSEPKHALAKLDDTEVFGIDG